MRIKRVEIIGFKSFVEKTSISFQDPVTAIVGPNGCGKSNIVDAIRWVMGEQSAKHLRGRAMEDVIFAGSETRGPAGLAEVSLTFDGAGLHGDATAGGVPWGAVGPDEIVVTRRLYRDGQSEYLLNGVPSRLRDVVEFFLGTGVGSKAYAIIEQGRIGFIVSSRAEDRRGLIDEAAGITKYKVKKKAAERRIESTRQHLLRVSDVIGEIEGRLRSLRLQAAKAERYKRYKGELRDLDLWSASQRFLGHLAEEKSLQAQIAELHETHGNQSTALELEEAAVEIERLAVSEEQSELGAAKDALFSLSNKAQLGFQRAQYQEDEADQLSSRASSERREIESLTARRDDAVRASADIEEQWSRVDEEASSSRALFEEKEQAYEGLRQALSTARRDLDVATSQVSQGLARTARNEAEQGAAAARQEDLRARMENIALEDATTAEGVAARLEDVESLRASLATIEERRAELTDRKQEAERRLATLRADVSRGELELETLREESHRRRSRLGSLVEIQDRYESFHKGVRAIMQNRREREGQGEISGIRGVVADIVQPPPELETAVEAVLGERLGNVIVESADVGVEAIKFLKSRSEGRSSFIPVALRTLEQEAPIAGGASGTVVYDASGGVSVDPPATAVFMPATNDQPPPEFPARTVWPTGEGVRGPLLDLIGYDRAFDKVATYLLGDVLVVENLTRALELWRETRTTKTIVTLDGEVVDPHGVVTGGSRESSVGVLEQKREMRELEQVVAKLESDYQETLARHVATKQALADVTRDIEQIVADVRTDEVALVSQRKDLERANDEQRRLDQRRQQLANETANLARNLEDAERRRETAANALAADAELIASAEDRVSELRAATLDLGQQLDLVSGELTALKVTAAQAEDRRKHAQATLERLRAEAADCASRMARLDSASTEALARAEMLREEAATLREEAGLQQAEAAELARAHAERQGAMEERHGTLSRREADLRAARSDVARMSQTLSKLELRCQEVSLKRTSLSDHVATRYADVELITIVSDFHMRPPVGDPEEARMTELRGLIERMGEINLTAIEESEESQKRFDFLSEQKADLESAITQLEAAIEKINRASRKRFRETFDAVDAKFQEVYPRMFGGGRAHLRLTDESDMLETGIDIIANPPGKKVMQNIELLSGGEKALTAVSLLFAIFLVKPSPFCVLDEVDAPLDEANVGRFNEMVRAMTDRSQFIIISHNRRTMEIADRLCGITMEEPGVSKLVGVNLRSGPDGKRARASVLTESRPQA
ncbi:MAG TPA: chromosome segregation protein SMC [Polyangia bacterium]|jgi:chromosome segregation protein